MGLNNACGAINEAARFDVKVFEGDELNTVRREAARLMESIDLELLARLGEAISQTIWGFLV